MLELALPFERRDGMERAVTALVWAISGGILLFFVYMLAGMIVQGHDLISWGFLVDLPQDSGRTGGIGSVLVSTLWIVGAAIALALPLAVATAAFLVEFQPRTSIQTRLAIGSLDVLAAVPSVVFGLFGNAVFCELLGFGYSLLSGALTLVCMVLPVMIKAAIDSLRSVPREMRAAGSALALNKTALLWHIVLPAALPGIVSGTLLGIARALAETAALLFTSGYALDMPESFFDSGRTVSIHIYDLSMNVPGGDAAAYGSTTVLIVLMLLVNVSVVGVGKYARRRSRAVSR